MLTLDIKEKRILAKALRAKGYSYRRIALELGVTRGGAEYYCTSHCLQKIHVAQLAMLTLYSRLYAGESDVVLRRLKQLELVQYNTEGKYWSLTEKGQRISEENLEELKRVTPNIEEP